VPINISGARHDGGERTVSLSGANYRPDIGFFDASGQLVGAFRVHSPFGFFIGPGLPLMRAQNDARRAALAGPVTLVTGGFRWDPCAL